MGAKARTLVNEKPLEIWATLFSYFHSFLFFEGKKNGRARRGTESTQKHIFYKSILWTGWLAFETEMV